MSLSPRVFLDWQRQYGEFPDDYCAIDCETSGLDLDLDRILQVGIVLVRGRKAVFSKSYVIGWTYLLDAPELDDLALRMRRTAAAFERKNRNYPWNLDLLAARGEPPTAVAVAIKEDLGDHPYCVGHYAWGFDFPRMARFLNAHSSKFDVYQTRLYDTCLMTRAALANQSPQVHESPLDYFRRIDAIRGMPPCKLEDCIARFGLEKQGAAPSGTHMAEYDAWAAHLFFEKHRELAHAFR